ncbi:pentapeptide repeat-containing protein [Oceanispirochaeta crateris]|uniref:Pentapeptide repeat-containing protein n=2 Tax=Oceanispirochaeta crateris TaxID=2518645 RepID=A0A5C1QNG6_9SPIO|nr:pentapeptide repeat-containing protein [Oceanispirochaeta crateris]
MFNLDLCSWPGCKNPVDRNSRFCNTHIKMDYQKEIENYLLSNEVIMNLKAPGLIFEGLDLRGKRFINCYFHHTLWKNCRFDNSRFQMCFFDDSVITNCHFLKVNMLQCVFTMAVLQDTTFRGSDLISVNLNRIKSRHCDFSESDLYYSRFIGSSLKETLFVDCNLKRVDFCLSRMKRISFRYSNSEEAYFQKEHRG